jgi:fused signal recognition particle receptor
MNDSSKQNWWQRLSGGLRRTSSSLGMTLSDLVTKRKLDAAMVEELEEELIRADLGVAVAARIAEAVGEGRYDKEVSPDDVKTIFASEIEKVLVPVAQPLTIDVAKKPFVILVIGVNGSGKTTTIGKLAAKLRDEGRKVMLAAGDTFRAAAIEQLVIWGGRVGASVITREPGSDAAGLAFDAIAMAS